MKRSLSRIVISHALFLVFFASASLALAQSPGTASTTRPDEVKERISNLRSSLDERAQERIENLAANISNRIDAAIARLQNIIDRLTSRIKKLEERGINTSEASTHLDSAQKSLNLAKQEMSGIDQIIKDAISSEDVRAKWLPVRQKFLTIKDHLKNSHTSLRACIASLKSALDEATDTNGVSEAVRNNSENTETE